MHAQVTTHHLALWRPGRPRGREGQVLFYLFLASAALPCSERLAGYGFCRFLTSHSCHADSSLITGPSVHSVFSQQFIIKHKLVPSVLFSLRRRIIPRILAFLHSPYFLLSEFSFITLISKLSTFPLWTLTKPHCLQAWHRKGRAEWLLCSKYIGQLEENKPYSYFLLWHHIHCFRASVGAPTSLLGQTWSWSG